MDSRLDAYIDRLDKRLKLKTVKGRLTFTVTEKLCVYDDKHRDFTLNLLSNISYSIIKYNHPVHLDLKKCPNISAAAIVMLFAEISRARMVTADDNIITVELSDEFDQDDFSDAKEAIDMGFREYSLLFDRDHTFQTVSDPQKAIISIMNLLYKSGVVLNRPDTAKFTKGVTEAMLNVIHHAYSDQSEPLGGIGRRWWQACWLEKNEDGENRLIYIIYDLGCGVLNTLPKLNELESACEHINRAMRYGVSRTGESDRGKGTKNMVDATDIRDNSTMFIGTNHVIYYKIEGEESITKQCLLPFDGTLVEWQICIDKGGIE